MVTSSGTPQNQIDLPKVADSSISSTTLDPSTDLLTVVENGSSFSLQLSGTYSAGTVVDHVADSSGSGSDLFLSTPVCFCRGTMILTERGDVAVEALSVGDRVKTFSGTFKRIVWIGLGRSLLTRANKLARPIVVRRGALAEDVPRRDLYLTHGHALFFDGALVPVEHLVNHRSIAWDDTARVIEYYHIELSDHDVIYAEGAAAETYYDANNRALFQNTREGSEASCQKPTCAPVLHDGEIVGKIWAELYERAGGRQFAAETTSDPDLHLLLDGWRLDPVTVDDGVYTFALERSPSGGLVLRSRSGVPSLLGMGRHDHRRLGVAIRQLILQQAGVLTCFDHQAPLFSQGGAHAAEDVHCWTDGELALPPSLFAHLTGEFRLVVQTIGHDMRYPRAAPAALAA